MVPSNFSSLINTSSGCIAIFPKAIDLYNPKLMTQRGRGKYIV